MVSPMSEERKAELWQLVHEGCLNCHLIKECLEEIGLQPTPLEKQRAAQIDSLQAVIANARRKIEAEGWTVYDKHGQIVTGNMHVILTTRAAREEEPK